METTQTENHEAALDAQIKAIPPHHVVTTVCRDLPRQITMSPDTRSLLAHELNVDPAQINIGSYKIFDWQDKQCPGYSYLNQLRNLRTQLTLVGGMFSTPDYSTHFKGELAGIVPAQKLDSMHIIASEAMPAFEAKWAERMADMKVAADKMIDGYITSDGDQVDIYQQIKDYYRNVKFSYMLNEHDVSAPDASSPAVSSQWTFVEKRWPTREQCRTRMLSHCYKARRVSTSLDYAGLSKEVRLAEKEQLISGWNTVCSHGVERMLDKLMVYLQRLGKAVGPKSRFSADPDDKGLRNAEIIMVEEHSTDNEVPVGHLLVTYCKAKKSEKREGFIRDGVPAMELWSLDKYNAHKPTNSGEYGKLSTSVLSELNEMTGWFNNVKGLLDADLTVGPLLEQLQEELDKFGKTPEHQAAYLKQSSSRRNMFSSSISEIAAQAVEVKKHKQKRFVKRGG